MMRAVPWLIAWLGFAALPRLAALVLACARSSLDFRRNVPLTAAYPFFTIAEAVSLLGALLLILLAARRWAAANIRRRLSWAIVLGTAGYLSVCAAEILAPAVGPANGSGWNIFPNRPTGAIAFAGRSGFPSPLVVAWMYFALVVGVVVALWLVSRWTLPVMSSNPRRGARLRRRAVGGVFVLVAELAAEGRIPVIWQVVRGPARMWVILATPVIHGAMLFVLVTSALALWRLWSERGSLDSDLVTCPGCGYPLGGLRGTTCPECGTAYSPADSALESSIGTPPPATIAAPSPTQ